MTENENRAIAEAVADYDRSAALLTCGVEDKDILALTRALEEQGWHVHPVTPEYFRQLGGERIASVTIVCDGAALPEDCGPALERYLTQNGRLFLMGGPLFGLTDITRPAMVLEGVSPLYKTYRVSGCEAIRTLPQCVTSALLDGAGADVICPSPRPDGGDFSGTRRCRMLSVAEAEKGDGRDGANRGAAAFFMLTDTLGHLVATSGTRLGNVSPITRGSVTAVVGMPLPEILTRGGLPLVCDMMAALGRGVFLMEGGAADYVSEPEKETAVGARILSAARDHLPLRVRIRIGEAVQRDYEVLAAPQNETVLRETLPPLPEGSYRVVTELWSGETRIDQTEGELFVTAGRHTRDADAFVRVRDGSFYCGGKRWYPYGINYWPLYHVSQELNDYWRGAFDRSDYIPAEVEKDLTYLERLGMNAVSIRIDGNTFDALVQPLKDFFCRCARHGLKVMMSFCNITNPLYFQEAAFRELMARTGLADDPVLMAHDIFWESGGNFCADFYGPRWRPAWNAWLEAQYGSLSAARADFGLPTSEAGPLDCPAAAGFTDPGASRTEMGAYSRFLEDLVCRKWEKAIRAMKQVDSNHLYTNRMGHLSDNTPNVFLSAAAKYMDFLCLEAYSFTCDEAGFAASAALHQAASFVSGGKPVTWVEYGISLPGMSGLAVGTPLLWDGEGNRPLPRRLEDQRAYQAQMNRMFRLCDVKGSFPWFYAGGFRFTEHSDAGYVNPDGTPRPAMTEYAAIGPWMTGTRQAMPAGETVTVDPEGDPSGWCHIVYGKGTFSKFAWDRAMLSGTPRVDDREYGPGSRAALRAEETGACFAFATPGTGTTSANTPLTLRGGAPYRGGGALAYLNALLPRVTLEGPSGRIDAEDGDTVMLASGRYRVRVVAANLGQALWLAGQAAVRAGDVVIRTSAGPLLRLTGDAAYLEDGVAEGELDLQASGLLTFRAEALERAAFGPPLRLQIRIKGETK